MLEEAKGRGTKETKSATIGEDYGSIGKHTGNTNKQRAEQAEQYRGETGGPNVGDLGSAT